MKKDREKSRPAFIKRLTVFCRSMSVICGGGAIFSLFRLSVDLKNHNTPEHLWNFLYIGIFLFVVVLSIFLLYSYTTEKENEQSGVKKAEDHPQEAEPELSENEYVSELLMERARAHALQSQINPHFLYNTLDTIRSHAISRNQREIAEMTEALARIFRYSISKKSDTVTFSEELYNIDKYLLIQQYRFQNRFEIIKRFDKTDERVMMELRMPILTIQPIIENAIYHGLEPKSGIGHIVISAYLTESLFIINIYDNGVGMDEEQLEQIRRKLHNKEILSGSANKEGNHSGIAITNVNSRIKHYFGEDYGLDIMSTKGVGTWVEIILPQIQTEADGEKWGLYQK